jgi:hypothetical protein
VIWTGSGRRGTSSRRRRRAAAPGMPLQQQRAAQRVHLVWTHARRLLHTHGALATSSLPRASLAVQRHRVRVPPLLRASLARRVARQERHVASRVALGQVRVRCARPGSAVLSHAYHSCGEVSRRTAAAASVRDRGAEHGDKCAQWRRCARDTHGAPALLLDVAAHRPLPARHNMCGRRVRMWCSRPGAVA